VTRIVGGRWSGRRLTAPPGDATRPTSEKVRAAVANALAATGALEGASVLDLYAGSGALGLELASRGAASVVFVERARAAQAAIRANIAALLSGATMTLFGGDAASFAVAAGERFDVVVADPPYAEPAGALAAVLAALRDHERIAAGADIVIERAARGGDFVWPDAFEAVRTRRYGDTVICYGRAV
jgi:16S rRNA (guanine966-N2)-methyltransferase